jgi:hypothetical protein
MGRSSAAANVSPRRILAWTCLLVGAAALTATSAWADLGPGVLQSPGPLFNVGTKGVRLKEPVQNLAADGNHVAYSFCGQLVAWWAPGSRTGGRFGPPAQFTCPPPSSPERVYSLAVTAAQVGYAVNYGGIQTNSWIKVVPFAQAANVKIVASQVACCRGSAVGEGRMGFVVGQGSLLAFTRWQLCGETGTPACGVGSVAIVASSLYSVPLPPSAGSACPGEPFQCTQIGTAPSLVGAISADSGRLALLRADGSLAVVNATGAVVSIYPVTTWGQTLAAELGGGELVQLSQGSLRHFDVMTGLLQHTWPVANVTAGGTCRRLPCPSQLLTLEDVSGGLVAYTLQGQVHVLRLSDGRDVVVAAGTRAQFVTSGLVYAYESTGGWPYGLRWLRSAQIAATLGP